MKPRIVFFGNERLGTGLTTTAPTLQALIAAGYDVAAVVVAQREMGSSRKPRALEIVGVAEAHNIPVLSPPKLADAKNDLKDLGAQAAVLVAYGKIVPQSIIDLFPVGIINIHPSLLPKHRGPTPIESVILQSDKETGVSLMQLAAEMDAGPVYAQETVLLKGNETKQILAEQLLNLGKDMLLQYLPSILTSSLAPQAQNDKLATYDKLIEKSASELQFTKPATELDREVRAYAAWPRSRAKVGTTEVIITAAHVIEGQGVAGTLWINGPEFGIHARKDILVIDRLIPAGKKEMSAAEFLAGYNPTAV